MDKKQAKQYLEKNKNIEGWFSIHDVIAFSSILTIQREVSIPGSLLEIGVYQGKSAILVGKFSKSEIDFEVCDIFQLESDDHNNNEIISSYLNLQREIFEDNCRKNLDRVPIIHECKSMELRNRLKAEKYRFIHIDGSHLYEHVLSDIELALEVLTLEDGIIVMDDFRSQHTLGVSLAIWEKIIDGGFTPFLVTPAKMYLSKKRVNLNLEVLHKTLADNGLKAIYENVGQFKLLRTIDLPDGEIYNGSHFLRDLVPPIIAKLIRRLI
jgi:cephalosporin hydroxylase